MNISVEQTINGYKVTVDRAYDTKMADALNSVEGINVIDVRRPERPSKVSYIYVSSYLTKEDIMDVVLRLLRFA